MTLKVTGKIKVVISADVAEGEVAGAEGDAYAISMKLEAENVSIADIARVTVMGLVNHLVSSDVSPAQIGMLVLEATKGALLAAKSEKTGDPASPIVGVHVEPGKLEPERLEAIFDEAVARRQMALGDVVIRDGVVKRRAKK